MKRSSAIFATLFLLAACTKVGTGGQEPAGSQNRHSWTHAGTLRIGIQSEPSNLNTILTSDTTANAIARLVFDPLLSADEKGTTVPVLASEVPTLENGGISKDGLTITYHLRPNVKWQDGAPFTSDDVKFSWQAMMNPNNNVISRRGYDVVARVDTPDAHTAVFHMKRAFAPAINTIFAESDTPYGIIPAHLLRGQPNVNHLPFNSSPIGTGPFRVVKWQHGDHIEMAANDEYFLGKPKVRKLLIKVIPDENTEVNQLRTHEIDWMFEASTATYNVLKTVPNIKLVLVPHNGYEGIQFNTKKPALSDPRVRKAIAYAIDKTSLVQNLTYGSAKVATEDLPDFMWANNPDVTVYKQDFDKAKQLLADGGWRAAPDGVMTKNGTRLSLDMAYNGSNVTRAKGVVEAQAMLRKIGVELHPKAYNATLLFATYGLGGILQTGKFDTAWAGWVAGIDPDNSSQFMCSFRPPNGNNTTFYCNPQMDDAQRTSLQHLDEPTRKAAYAKIEALLADDMPQLFIWWPQTIQAINPDFHGFRPNPVTETWNAYQWEI